jgi:tellurite resistance protein TehA-like permease
MEAFGVIGSRQLFGAAFPRIDAFVTLLSPAALAGTLLLGKRNAARFWLVVAVICWLLGIYVIFYQYYLWEQLYGVDGMSGPYSK